MDRKQSRINLFLSLFVLSTFTALVAVLAPPRAAADGAPEVEPLVYSGVLEENGVPVPDGVLPMELRLWVDPTSTDAAARACTTSSPETAVSRGRFRITLDASCVEAVRVHTDVWIEVVLGAVSLGRTKVGAVPYALEATRASTAAGSLAEALVPRGMIALFFGPCPPGWSEFAELRGRTPRGGADALALLSGGSDDLAVVAHSHGFTGSTAGAGDHQHGVSGGTDGAGAHDHGFSGATAGAGDHAHSGTTGSGNAMFYRVVPQTGYGINSAHVVGPGGGAYADYVDAEWPMAGHTHNFGTNVAGGHNHGFGGTTAGVGPHAHGINLSTGSAGGHTHGFAGNTAASGVAGEGLNLSRYQEVVFCRRD